VIEAISKEFQIIFVLVSRFISKELQVTLHVFNVGEFQKVGCNFYFQVLFQKKWCEWGRKNRA
jgi:hypothetical protein